MFLQSQKAFIFPSQITTWNLEDNVFLLCSSNNGDLLIFHLPHQHIKSDNVSIEKIFDQNISSLPLSFNIDSTGNEKLLMVFNREASYTIEIITENHQQKMTPKLNKLHLSADKIAAVSLDSGQEIYLILNGGILEAIQIHLQSRAWLNHILSVPFAKKLKLNHNGKQMTLLKSLSTKHEPPLILYRENFEVVGNISAPSYLKAKDVIVLNDELFLVLFSSSLDCPEDENSSINVKNIGEIVLYKIYLKKSEAIYTSKRISSLSFPYEVTHIHCISEQ